VPGLAAVAVLELDLVGDQRGDALAGERRVLAGDAGNQLAAVTEGHENLRQGRLGAPQATRVSSTEAERVAGTEAALSVIAGGRSDRAAADALEAASIAAAFSAALRSGE